MKFEFWCLQIKAYWNINMSIWFPVVYGCFPSRAAELSSRDRDLLALKTPIRVIRLFTAKLVGPCSRLCTKDGSAEAKNMNQFHLFFKVARPIHNVITSVQALASHGEDKKNK